MRSLKAILSLASAIVLSSCLNNTPDAPVVSEKITEEINFTASVADDTKVDFEYSTAMFTRWHGDEILHVYIKHNDGTIEQPEAGIIEAVPGSLSDNRCSIDFSGSVRGRKNPETDTFIFIYANLGSVTVGSVEKLVYGYDFTKQNIDASDAGLGSLKNCFPIVFEEVGGNVTVEKKACIIKLAAANLPANAKVTSVNFFSSEAVFPKVVDVTSKGFAYQSTNLSNTLSYVLEGARTDNEGKIELYLAAPLVQGEKNYEITMVCEDNGEYVSKKASNGISGTSALSASKLYKLSRDTWQGGVNPGTVVGSPEDKMESVVGQWDKTGYLSNDVYGVLEKGKPQYLSLEHNAIINAVQKAYRKSSASQDNFVHPAAVRAAGLNGYPEETGQTISANGPQHVAVTGKYSSAEDLTFNNIRLTKDTYLYMTFIDSQAYNTNTIGYYCYPTAMEDAYKTLEGHERIHEMVVFPSTSQDLRDPTVTHKFDAKTTAKLLYPEYDSDNNLTGVLKQSFAAGTTVGLFGYTNGLDNTRDFAIKELPADPTAGGVHYTNIAWNRRNKFAPQNYWNQIAVLRVKMPGEREPRTDCVIVAMKDKYMAHGVSGAATWTNPIILIYASTPGAIDFTASENFWTETVDLNPVAFGISYDTDGVTSTNTATTFSGSYESVFKVANTEFGSFCNFSVIAGEIDITERVTEFNEGRTEATVRISRADAAGDIRITAHAAKNIMVQSLTAAQLLELAEQTGDLPTYRLILHSQVAGSVAFGMNKNGSYCRAASQCPFAGHLYTEPTIVRVEDQYNDYEWSLEKETDGNGNFLGFRLKKVTKITDTEMQLEGYIKRASSGTTYLNLADTGTVLTAEQTGSGYEMFIKSADNAYYQYMTCAFGSNLQNAVFWYSGAHVNNFGKWRVYKVWLQDAVSDNN